MRNYLKKKENTIDMLSLSADEFIAKTIGKNKKITNKAIFTGLFAIIAIPVLCITISLKKMNQIDTSESSLISLTTAPISATATKKNFISIPTGTVKANPFLPYRDIGGSSVSDVPKYDLVAPPEVVNENSDAARVMDTIVSGILYDKFSPSAILNIEGNDYLVKKGDVVNNYKILNITQNRVSVKLGNNTYNAGIGEILTEGSVNYNDVSNLNKKFGGLYLCILQQRTDMRR